MASGSSAATPINSQRLMRAGRVRRRDIMERMGESAWFMIYEGRRRCREG